MLLIDSTRKVEKKRKGIPKELIYEMRYGKPIYYRDYDKVLKGELPLEAVMGSGYLQWKIISLILKFLFLNLSSKYDIATNEAGYKWAPKTWRNLDIAIFDKSKLEKEGLHTGYVKTPPEVVIEIDTKADLRKYGDFMNYAREKIDDLLNAGVNKIIWFTTFDKKVMIAEKNKPWLIDSWNIDIEISDGIILNLKKLIDEENLEIGKEENNG